MANWFKELGKGLEKSFKVPATVFWKAFAGKDGLFNTMGQSFEAFSQGDIAGGVKRIGGGETTAKKTARQQKEAVDKANRISAHNSTVQANVSRLNKTEEMESANIMSKFGQSQSTDNENAGSSSGGVINYVGGGSGESLAMRIARQKKQKGVN